MKAARAGLSPHWYFVLLAAVVIFFSIIRFRLRDVPLERDEGEYAYAGQLILHGIAPYKLAYNMKLPGTYAAYSLMMAIFGQSPAGIHAGLLLVNAATVLLLFLLAQRLFGPVAGLVAGSSYALLSSSESVLGLAGHATHFVVLAALGGVLLLLRAVETGTTRLYFWSGFLLGLAFVLKQPGIFFALFGGFYLIVSEWRGAKPWRGVARVLAVYSAGGVAPFALTCLLLFFAGALSKMWFWTFSYGSLYASAMSLSDGWQELVGTFPSVVQSSFLMWILAAVGLAASGWDSGARKYIVFIVGFLLFSWFAVCPGFYFRHHYFILVLPAVCLLIGLAVSSATHELLQRFRSPALAAVPALIFLTAFVISIAQQSEIFFQLDPLAVCREVYGSNPFLEAPIISEYLKQQTTEGARIAVVGSEPEIYFYSRRRSATGYIYTYPLLEPQKYALDMQKDMVSEIEKNSPEYMVFVKVHTSWLPRPGSSTFILEWFKRYVAAQYEIVGIADEVPPSTRYIWGDAAKTYREQSDAAIEVFKRKNI